MFSGPTWSTSCAVVSRSTSTIGMPSCRSSGSTVPDARGDGVRISPSTRRDRSVRTADCSAAGSSCVSASTSV